MIRDSNTLLCLAIHFESGTCSITQILSLSTLLCSTFVQAAQKRHAFINRGIGRRSAARRPGGGWRPHLSLTIFLGRRSAESLGICLADQQRPCVAWARSFILFFFGATPGNGISHPAMRLPASYQGSLQGSDRILIQEFPSELSSYHVRLCLGILH